MIENDATLTPRLGRRDLLVLGLAGALSRASARRLPPPSLALFAFAVAGGFYHGLGRMRGRLTPGMLLDLRAEPANPHDANAVEVLMPADGPHAGLKLGCLPRCGNRAAALWLARGAVLRAAVVGRRGKRPGETIRCVVSVSMLTEGWDARTVTHILGVRAFGTQLLCEQVIGRALRRVSYDPVGTDDAGHAMFAPEYADVLGIPFSFVPANSAPDYTPPQKQTHVHAVLSERVALEIRFPRVIGYRTVLPPGRVTASFTDESRLAITPEDAPPDAINAAIIGAEAKLSLYYLKAQREATIAFHLAGHTLRRWFRDSEDHLKPRLFPSLLGITRRWMAECLSCVGGTFPAYLLWRDIGDQAAERIHRACVETAAGAGRLRAMLDPYDEAGSSRHLGFATTKTNFWPPRADKCQLNLIVCDQDWEAAAAQALDGMDEVAWYGKNDRLGFEVPYVHGGQERHYRPDFIVVLEDGRGPGDPLHLALEVKGRQTPQDDAKHDTMRSLWVPAVNALGRFGRWDFLRVDGPYGVDEAIRHHLAARATAPLHAA